MEMERTTPTKTSEDKPRPIIKFRSHHKVSYNSIGPSDKCRYNGLPIARHLKTERMIIKRWKTEGIKDLQET
jgi:hypothetical protein